MRHWKTKLTALCAAAAMLLPMTGCSLTASAEELFTLPEFPVEYTGLSNQLNALLGQGYEYGSPTARSTLRPSRAATSRACRWSISTATA